jgi:anti-anti-sigma regulatory factor
VLDALRGRAVEGVAFDMGAVRMIDPPAFRHLAETARMVSLLGGEPVFAGFRPGAAAVLVDLDADVSGVRAFRTLEEAIGAAAEGPEKGRIGRAGLGADGRGTADRAP